MRHYTQAYPPRELDLLKSWIARHWKRGDPTRRLPKPPINHILVRDIGNNNNIWKASPSRGRILSASHQRIPNILLNTTDMPTEEL